MTKFPVGRPAHAPPTPEELDALEVEVLDEVEVLVLEPLLLEPLEVLALDAPVLEDAAAPPAEVDVALEEPP